MKRVSVIIPNYNGEEFLPDCLYWLERQSFKDFEVIVVDNGSTDGSKKIIKEKFSSVKLVELDKNYGFAYACAKGLELSQGEEIVIINNDALADSEWLLNLVKAVELDERIGMVASEVKRSLNGELESIGLVPAKNGLVYLEKRFKRKLKEGYVEVFGASGVASLYRRKMLKEVGFFEKDYFAYYEDADLAFRARRRGYKAVCALNAHIFHQGSLTGSKLKMKDFYLARNRLRTIVRNWDLKLILKNIIFIAGYEIASFLGGIILAKPGVLKARIEFIKFLRKDLQFRKREMRIRAKGYELGDWLEDSYPGLFELGRRRL